MATGTVTISADTMNTLLALLGERGVQFEMLYQSFDKSHKIIELKTTSYVSSDGGVVVRGKTLSQFYARHDEEGVL